MDGNGVGGMELFKLLVNKLVTTGWLFTIESSAFVLCSIIDFSFGNKLLTIGVVDKDSQKGDKQLALSLTILFGSIT